jgi:lysozyme
MKNKRNLVVGGSLAMAMVASMTAYFESSGKMITKAYRDPAGVPTICDGITKGVYIGMEVTEEWCRLAKEKEITNHSRPLQDVTYDLPIGPKVGLTDLSFNIGEQGLAKSTSMKRLKAGDIQGACDAILMWKYVKINGVQTDCSKSSSCRGIWIRRNAERDVCLGEISVRDAQKLFINLPVGGELWEQN